MRRAIPERTRRHPPAAFPPANLLDWPWALTGTGALWALAVGGLLAWRPQCV
jgi:hypothetical protein